MGDHGNVWNGLCRPPWLKTIADADNGGTYYGGGFWTEPTRLEANFYATELQWHEKHRLPFAIEGSLTENAGDEGVLSRRLRRDGWTLVRDPGFRTWRVKPRDECPEWHQKPSNEHPTLVLWPRGDDPHHGAVYEFALQGWPDIIDKQVTWAAYDGLGQLVLTRAGILERYTLDDLRLGRPSFTYDTNLLRPPERVFREPRPSDALSVVQATATDVEAVALALRYVSDEEMEALRLAGTDAQEAFARVVHPGVVPDEPFASDPFYLRYHVLLHVEPSSPSRAIWQLLEAAVAQRIPSLAIGAALTKGDEAVCVRTARLWLETHSVVEAVFVAGDADQAAMLQAALETSE